MNELQEMWKKTTEALRDTHEISAVSYQTWIGSMKPVALEGNCLYAEAVSDMHRNQVKHCGYQEYIMAALMMVTGKAMQFRMLLSNEVDATLAASNARAQRSPMLNEKYSFENFVIGGNNQFAHAAALSVAEAPASQNNPLFIYGGTGLGKTHLMHAIGNYSLQMRPNTKVLYTSCEKYTNEYIDAITRQQTLEFRAGYRKNVDILMIDDVQFLSGKERIQEELFHNINELYNANKQIVLTSDRPPRSISTLEERLRSRFEGGLMVDITPPDLETRVAILRMKAEDMGTYLENDILFYIAERASDNVRELEGALKRVQAHSSFLGKRINMDTVAEALKDYQTARQRFLTPEVILETVADYFSISREDILGNKRDAAVVMPRHITMYLCRENTDLSYKRIAEELNRSDHTTVIHGIGKILEAMKTDNLIKNYVNDLGRRLQGN